MTNFSVSYNERLPILHVVSFFTSQGKLFLNVLSLVSFKTVRLPIVALVISATVADITGNFETKARSLGMKPKVCCRPFATITREVYSNILFLIYLLPFYVFCHGHVSFGLNVIDHTLLQYHGQILYEPHS